MPSFRATSATLALLSLVPSVLGDCESYGIDFTNGGTFFQNSNSTDPFTALQEFTGCQNDSAHNVFVDPNGDQSECSQTPLQPDNTPQLVTCEDWPKDRLYDGEWSLLIISNNGDADPIAYQRDFSLTVGEQQTCTVTPTLTVSNVETPVVNVTSTTMQTITQTAKASTITSGRGTFTVTPKPTTTTTTRGLVTITQYTQTWDVVPSTTTVAASCSIQPTKHVKDHIANIIPTVLGDLNGIVEEVINLNKGILDSLLGGLFRKSRFNASFHFRREILAGRTPSEELKKAFLAERAANLKRNALDKRSIDERTKTVNATTPVTSTVMITAATTTQTITITQQSTITSTPSPVTAAPVTVTANQSTRTKQVNLAIVFTTQTKTYTTTIVNTATTVAPGAVESCAAAGGILLD